MKFKVPYEDGGFPILNYAYEIRSNDGTDLIGEGVILESKRMLQASDNSDEKSFVFDRDMLKNIVGGKTYKFSIAAVNELGTG